MPQPDDFPGGGHRNGVCRHGIPPSSPDFDTSSPGPGREAKSWIGWTPLRKTARSGARLFRGALQEEGVMSALLAAGDWVKKKGSYHTAWSVSSLSSCRCSYSYGQGAAVGPKTGRRCWPLFSGVWRAIAPMMKPWCAEAEVPIAANLAGRMSQR